MSGRKVGRSFLLLCTVGTPFSAAYTVPIFWGEFMTIKILVASALLLNGLMWTAPVSAQSIPAPQSAGPRSVPSPQPKTATSKSSASKPTASPAKKGSGKPLVYLNDARSSKSSAASENQKSEIANAFEQNCSSVELTDDQAKAGYQMTVEQEADRKGLKNAFGLTNVMHKMTLVTVTSKSGKSVFSQSGHSTTQLVNGACTAIANGTPAVNVAER